MARPRVFVSSTYYDLKYIRSSLELFIQSLGYEAVLSEKGGIAYNPDLPLDESAYREVENCDMYVLIVGGRYGSEISEGRSERSKTFYDTYESITRREFKSALAADTPIYILIEKSVYAEYDTFLRNRENRSVVYAHVESVNVFQFIEEILRQRRNNPFQTFERYAEIESWLRDQWSGLFRDMLFRRTAQSQIKTLSSQVAELREVTETLKRYLEEVVSKIAPTDAAGLIQSESERLEMAREVGKLASIYFFGFLSQVYGIDLVDAYRALLESETLDDFATRLLPLGVESQHEDLKALVYDPVAIDEINKARERINKQPFSKPPKRKRGVNPS